MTPLLADMLPVATLGLFVAIPFGPVGLMCVQRTLALGLWFGIATGMGAAVAHGLFGFLVETGAAALVRTALAAEVAMRFAGGLILVMVGLRACLASKGSARDASCPSLLSAFISTLLIASANPMTILPYLAIAAVQQADAPETAPRVFAVPIGVMIGSASWYLALCLGTKAMLRKLQTAMLDRISILAGVSLIAAGVGLCIPMLR
jgi:threonine/homoserine/homoserine lactone efflux protein